MAVLLLWGIGLVTACGGALPSTTDAERDVVRIAIATGDVDRVRAVIDGNRYPAQRTALVDGLVAIVQDRGTPRQCEEVLAKYTRDIARPDALKDHCHAIEVSARKTIEAHIEGMFRGRQQFLTGTGSYIERAAAIWKTPPLQGALDDLSFVASIALVSSADGSGEIHAGTVKRITQVIERRGMLDRPAARTWVREETARVLDAARATSCADFTVDAMSLLESLDANAAGVDRHDVVEAVRGLLWSAYSARTESATCEIESCLGAFPVKTRLAQWTSDRRDVDKALVDEGARRKDWPTAILLHYLDDLRGTTNPALRQTTPTLLAATETPAKWRCMSALVGISGGKTPFAVEVDGVLRDDVTKVKSVVALAKWKRTHPMPSEMPLVRTAFEKRKGEIFAETEKIVLSRIRATASLTVATKTQSSDDCTNWRDDKSDETECVRAACHTRDGYNYTAGSCGYDTTMACLETRPKTSSVCTSRRTVTWNEYTPGASVRLTVPKLDLGDVGITVYVSVSIHNGTDENQHSFSFSVRGDKAETLTDSDSYEKEMSTKYPRITSVTASSVAFTLPE
ncbi:MAG: hypothetical protein ACHREM_03520 [Polyangiales bacterium]